MANGSSRGSSKGRVSVGALLVGLVLALAAASPWLLSGLGAGRLPVLAGIVAWRSALSLGAWAPVALLAVLLLVRPPARRVLSGLLIPALLLAVLACATLLPRPARTGGAAGGQPLRVLSWNINGSLTPASTIAAETVRHRPDVLVLPEVVDSEYQQLRSLLAPHGYVGLRHGGSEVAIFSTLGYRGAGPQDYGTDPGRESVAAPASPGLPTVVAVHLRIPFLRGGNAVWNREVSWLGQLCASRAPALIVGDFNGTDDNVAGTGLAGCTDAAAAMGLQHSGSWPTRLPPRVAMPIDHVMVADPRLRVTGFAVLTDQDGSGARHRPILAVLGSSGDR